MIAIIPAGGYGTRLKEATGGLPKGLIEIKGKPMVTYNLEKILELEEIKKVVLVTNNIFYKHYSDWAKNQNSKVPIVVINDKSNSNEERLGQVGDMVCGIKEANIDDDMLMVSSDNLFRENFNAVIQKFKETGKTINTIKKHDNIEVLKLLGNVEINETGKFIGFEEKPEKPKSLYSSTGLILFTRNSVKLMVKYVEEGNNPDKVGHFLKWLLERDDIYGVQLESAWFDIGSKEVLDEARRAFE